MFWYTVPVFGAYFGFVVYAEFRFHRARGLYAPERHYRALTNLLTAAGTAYALFVEYGTASQFIFELIAVASLILFPMAERNGDAQLSSRERFAHSWSAMLHPLMWIFVMVNWRFIDGAGFFMGIVLPFSTDNLRPLMMGFCGVTALFSLYQAVYWNLFYRAPLPVPVAGPTELPSEDNERRAS